jgi:biopolymer transport protein ExbD
MMSREVLASLAVVAVVACGQDKIEVRQDARADYNHAGLLTAVDAFVAAGRTPAAYAELSATASKLRPGMDRTVASETELKLLVLALAPVESVHGKPIDPQIDALALTVWPTLLAPVFAIESAVAKRDDRAAVSLPLSNEPARAYLQRLCGGPLAASCKDVVPERQGAIVTALAMRRATERVRSAIADCATCTADPTWHEAIRSWEALDRSSNATIVEIHQQADPDNWPVAGSAAELDPKLPEAEITQGGELVIDDQHYAPARRVAALRELRGEGTAIALHVRPEVPLAQVRALLSDVHKAGATRVAVVARQPQYPWDRRVYWLADGAGTGTGLRPTDSLQLLLHAVDAVTGSGTVAGAD